MRISKFYIFFIILSALIFPLVSCGDGNEPDIIVPDESRRTVLVYMAADNNLGEYNFDALDIDEMKSAAAAGDIGSDGRLIVYHDGYRAEPVLIEIKADGLDTLRIYDSATSITSSRMLEVFDDMTAFAPAREYGLVLWSHATGWIQDGIADELDRPVALSFGYQNGHTMNTTTLARTLESGPDWSFVYFDCCYMASVESIYELRNVAPVIVASVTELPSSGMPYDKNVKHFFARGSADLVGAATSTFDYYDSMAGQNRTCTMSVLLTEGMDALAAASRAIFEKADGTLPDSYVPQKYTNTTVWKSNYFDFHDYMQALCLADGAERFDGANALFAEFEAALAGVVKYEAATPYLWNSVPLTHHCGLSTFIMRSTDDADRKNYRTLGWFGDVAGYLTFSE